MALEVSVAFQGGGARVLELMAAARALKGLDTNSFRVFRVSGTSAGAIAAAMFATDFDFDLAIAKGEKLRGIIKSNFPESRLSHRSIIWRLARGLPIFEPDALKRVITEVFALGGVDAKKTVSELVKGTELRILGSNIVSHKVVETDETHSAPLWRVLADSSAIPFAFRMPKSTESPEILDGGLFQNLPSTAVTDNLKPNQLTLAFSFKPEKEPDLTNAGIKSYASAIVSSLINQHVEDSKSWIKQSNVIELESSRSTFDFMSIFDKRGLPDEFKDLVSKSDRRIREWIKAVENLVGPDQHSNNQRDLMDHIRRIDNDANDFFDKVKTNGYHAKEIHQEVVFNSFNEVSPDQMFLSIHLNGSDNNGLQFMKFNFYDGPTGPAHRAELNVSYVNGDPFPAFTLPIRNTHSPRMRSILLILSKPLGQNDDIIIRKSEISFNNMLDYINDGKTFQTLVFSPGRSAELARLSLHFPLNPPSMMPSHFADASPDLHPNEFEGQTGIQVLAHPAVQNVRAGCCSVVGSAAMSKAAGDQEQYIKLAFFRQIR